MNIYSQKYQSLPKACHKIPFIYPSDIARVKLHKFQHNTLLLLIDKCKQHNSICNLIKEIQSSGWPALVLQYMHFNHLVIQYQFSDVQCSCEVDDQVNKYSIYDFSDNKNLDFQIEVFNTSDQDNKYDYKANNTFREEFTQNDVQTNGMSLQSYKVGKKEFSKIKSSFGRVYNNCEFQTGLQISRHSQQQIQECVGSITDVNDVIYAGTLKYQQLKRNIHILFPNRIILKGEFQNDCYLMYNYQPQQSNIRKCALITPCYQILCGQMDYNGQVYKGKLIQDGICRKIDGSCTVVKTEFGALIQGKIEYNFDSFDYKTTIEINQRKHISYLTLSNRTELQNATMLVQYCGVISQESFTTHHQDGTTLLLKRVKKNK